MMALLPVLEDRLAQALPRFFGLGPFLDTLLQIGLKLEVGLDLRLADLVAIYLTEDSIVNRGICPDYLWGLRLAAAHVDQGALSGWLAGMFDGWSRTLVTRRVKQEYACLWRRFQEQTKARRERKLLAALQRAAKAAASAGPAATGPAGGRKRRMTVEEANEKAMELAKRQKRAFLLLSEREQAKRIGCHWRTWRKTTFYRKARRLRARLVGQARQREVPGSPPVASLTTSVEAVTGEGDRNEVLEQLIAQQEADREPSPLEKDLPDSPRKVRCRKRL
jgi:hypothetical protein